MPIYGEVAERFLLGFFLLRLLLLGPYNGAKVVLLVLHRVPTDLVQCLFELHSLLVSLLV